MAKIVSAEEAVSQIRDGDVVAISSSSALCCPDLVLKSLGERFEEEASPKDLTTLLPIAAGDMYGIKGIDHIAKDGLLKRVLAGSYPSGPSSKEMPAIWQMIVEDRVAAYNIPSGIMFDMFRDVAAHRPGVFTQIGMETYVDPVREGCAMNPRASAQPIVKRLDLFGETWLHFPNIIPNVAIIRATTADERGNLSFEHEGTFLGTRDLALATRNHRGLVIAQVKRITADGLLHLNDVHIPGHLVDLIVVDPDQKQTTNTVYDPAISGQIKRPWNSFSPVDHGLEKVLARRAAMELKSGDTAVLGFGISANVPRILIEEGYNRDVSWAIEQGAVGGVPLTGFAFGCSANADTILPSPTQFTYFQGGGFDTCFLSFMEVDINGNVNVSKLGKKPYLTAGCGGFVDITANARNIVFLGYFEASAELELSSEGISVNKKGKFTKFVEDVEHVTFAGRRAQARGHKFIYVTERCVIRLEDGLVATEIMPGIDPYKDIVEVTNGRVRISENATQMPKSLLVEGPMGLDL